MQYLLLEAMREVHWPAGPFNRLGEFPAEQPNDLPLSPTAEAFYRSGPTFWQRYTAFWISSLLSRIAFFIIPVLVTLLPLIGFAPRIYRWLYVRRINQLHRTLGKLERELAQSADKPRLVEYQKRITEIRIGCTFAQGCTCIRSRSAATQGAFANGSKRLSSKCFRPVTAPLPKS